MTFKEKLILGEGHDLVHKGSSSKGFMGETDVDQYDVVDQAGVKVGEVVMEDHTAVKGFARTQRLVQRDSTGRVIVDESWKPAK